MGLFDKKRKEPVPQAERNRQNAADPFDRYFESAFNQQQQRIAEENAEQAKREAMAGNTSFYGQTNVIPGSGNQYRQPVNSQQTATPPAYHTEPVNSYSAGYQQQVPRQPQNVQHEQAAVNSEVVCPKGDFEQQVSRAAENISVQYPVQNTAKIKNSTTLRKHNNPLVGSSSVIGRREYQQDALAVSSIDVRHRFDKKWLAVLCDGMGGMNGGEKASFLCIQRFLASFSQDITDVPSYYRNKIIETDREVAELCDADGRPMGAGSTLVSIVIDGDNLYWSSVGDSHIYIIRGNEFVRVNTEHNYLTDLLEQVKRGEITEQEAYNDKQKDALTSYMGIGGVSLMDVIEKPFKLQPGDFIILCSDGLYRSLSDNEIFSIVVSNAENMPKAASDLTTAALAKNYPHQDNTSVIVVNYR